MDRVLFAHQSVRFIIGITFATGGWCLWTHLHHAAIGAVQLASADMELRVRAKLGLSPEQGANWTHKHSDFSPLVRMLVRDADSSPEVLGKGHNEPVL